MINPLDWKFLDEPLWRWFTFLLAMSIILAVWNHAVLAVLP